MRRRHLGVVLVTALCLAATACSGFKTSDNSSGPVKASNVPKSALCPGKTPAKKITVVNVWTAWTLPAYLKSAQAFNCDHPDIAINISVNSTVGDDSNGKLLAAVAAHKGPDLVLSWDDVLAGWAARKRIEPIDTYVKSLKASDFVTEAWQSTQWGGHTYGIPFDWDPDSMLWYNKKVFAQAGLDPNKPPTTWAELQQDAAKIDSIKNGKIKRLGFVPWAGWKFNYLQLGHQFGADLKDGADTPPTVVADSPGMRKMFAYERQVSQKYGGGTKVNSFVSITGATGAAADPLLSGRVGMILNGDWQYGSAVTALGSKAKVEATIGVVPMPPPPGGKPFVSHSGWSYMVPSGAKNAQAAVEYAQWMEQSDNFGKYVGPVVSFLPARKATLSQSYLKDPIWQQIIAVGDKAGNQAWLPPSPILAQYYGAFDDAQSSVTILKQTPEQALAMVQKQAQSALDSAKSQGLYGK